jgi:hypothetical protein
VIALAVAAIFPLGEMAYEGVQTKRVGVIAGVSFIGIAVGFALSFATGNAIFALLKDSFFTGVFGLLFLASLATPRPLIYRLNLDLAGADTAARAASAALWERPAARRVFRLMTLVWGVGLLLEAGTRVGAAFALPIASATALSPLIAIVAIGGLLAWTVLYTRAQRAAATRASAPG